MEKENIEENTIQLLKNRIIKKEIKEISEYTFSFLEKEKKIKRTKSNNNIISKQKMIQNFIKKYSKNNLKIIILPWTIRKKNKLSERSIMKNPKKKIATFNQIKRVESFLGKNNMFGSLAYKTENNEIYLMTFKRIRIETEAIDYNCYHRKCLGYCSFDFNKINLYFHKEHTLNYNEHCSTVKKQIYYSLINNFSKDINIVMAIYDFNYKTENLLNSYTQQIFPNFNIQQSNNNININEFRIEYIPKTPLNEKLLNYSDIFSKILGKNKFFGSRYQIDNKGNIYEYYFKRYILNKGEFGFICHKRSCRCRGLYNVETKEFKLITNHDFECILPKRYLIINEKDKIINIENIFKEHPKIKEIQLIINNQ